MKIILLLLSSLIILGFAGGDVFAQKRKITIILVRHAEKDISDGGTSSDPNLSAEGRLRAQRFARLIKKYKPRRIYSTNYKRSVQTVAPLSERRKLRIQLYDPQKLSELAAQITSFKKGRRIVIVGHSNTVPALANLLVKENRYKNLAETEHNKIWIIRIKKGKIRAKVIEF